MKTQSMFRGLVVIAVSSAACVWLIATLQSCTRETLDEVEARTREVSRLVESAEGVLQSVFGTGVRIDSHGVIQVPKEIAELAVLEHDVSVTSHWSKARHFGWFPSTLRLTGNYIGKLGIDVEQVRGGFDPETGTLELDLPPAKVLSVEMTGLWRSGEDLSWFTPIGPHDVLELARRNRGQARSELDDLELLQAADRRLRERLGAASSDAGLCLRLVEPAG